MLETLLVLLLAFGTIPTFGANTAASIVGAEAVARLNILGNVSDSATRLERSFFSPAHERAAALLLSWLNDAGLRTWVDVVGNVHGRVEGSADCGGALLLGSHYDSVLDAGKFDGALGVVVAIAAVKEILTDKAPPRCALHVVAFSDEEGIRFHSTFLGSRVLAGTLDDVTLDARDDSNLSLSDVLRSRANVSGDADLTKLLSAAALPGGSVRAYVEVHIEQGPVLQVAGVPLAVVDSIAGQTFLRVKFSGQQGHAGTVPSTCRQ